MDNRKTIQTALDYIEENLKAEISVSDLSDMTGYSLYHFYRLFQSAVGMPVMQYILRRKLLNAIYDISSGLSKTDAALLYGFETYAGFYKAFKREIGYTPSDFLKRFKVKKPYKINLFKEEHIMLTHKKIAEILKHWGLQSESIKDIYYEETGERHENAYYIGDKYVIKATANLGDLKKQISQILPLTLRKHIVNWWLLFIFLISVCTITAIIVDYGFVLDDFETDIIHKIYSTTWWCFFISYNIQLLFNIRNIKRKAVILTIITGNIKFIFFSIISYSITYFITLMLWQLNVWGGGDVKLFASIAAVIPFGINTSLFNISPLLSFYPFSFTVMVNSILVSFPFLICLLAYMIVKNNISKY